MAYYGTTPPTQPQTELDLGALTIGLSKIVIDASWIGCLKEGSKVLWAINPKDKDIIVPAYPGTRLGVRQLGESPTATFESIEATLGNIRQYLDLQATVQNSSLGIGRRNKVGTTHTLDIYGEGPLQRTRRVSFYRVRLRVDGDINIADPEDFTTFRVVAEILPQMNLPEANWYGEISDSPPS
jgi:hypothetical protein